jgi:glycine/serine hydroxymethyltransferase
MARVAALIDRVLASGGEQAVSAEVREDVRALCAEFPVPH